MVAPPLDPGDVLLDLFRAVQRAGGRALLVGGSVRDALLGRRSKDTDIEVHELEADRLLPLLRRFGHVNEVGRSFGVFKLRMGARELDVGIPRRDSREGVGHRGIRAAADPGMGVREAARRRDLTVNAIAYDPLTDEWIDPFGGRADLAAGVLRAVDVETFGEDPLRALRVAQFAGRFGFAVDAELEALCAAMPLRELPAERIRGEVEKLLTKSVRPSVGWDFARRAGLWDQVLPEWAECPPRLDAVAAIPIAEEGRRLALLYAAACGRNDPDAAVRILDRLRVFRALRFPVRTTVLFLVGARDEAASPVPAPRVRRLADAGEVELLAFLTGNEALLATARALGVARAPLAPLLTGRDILGLGISEGAELGGLLAKVRELQLDGLIGGPEEARALVAEWVGGHFA